jgi:hypothetical protein
MPQVSYLVRTQVEARLSHQTTGLNYHLMQACSSQSPAPTPYTIDWSATSTNFWRSHVTAELLDLTSRADSGTLCMVYGTRQANQIGTSASFLPVKFAVFSGSVEIAVDIGWHESFDPSDTEGLPDATDDAMIQTFNSAAYFGSFGAGVIYNGLIRVERGAMRQTGPGWRQRLPYRLSFDVQV